MSARTRVEALEGATDATDAVLAWLADSLAHPSADAEAWAALGRGDSSDPARGALAMLSRGLRRDAGRDAFRSRYAREAQDAVLLVCLVRELQARAERRGELYAEALGRRAALLLMGLAVAPRDGDVAAWAVGASLLLDEVAVEQAARLFAERTWLRGATTLFPDTRRLWDAVARQQRTVEALLREPGLASAAARMTDLQIAEAARERAWRVWQGARLEAFRRLGLAADAVALGELLASGGRQRPDGLGATVITDPAMVAMILSRAHGRRPARLVHRRAAAIGRRVPRTPAPEHGPPATERPGPLDCVASGRVRPGVIPEGEA